MHDQPEAETYGRRVEAQAEIRVVESANDLTSINTEISGLMTALLSTDRETLRTDGIFKLNLQSLTQPDTDNGNSRVATFDISCEHQLLPAEAGDTIDNIVIRDLLDPANGRAEFISNLDAGQMGGLPDPLVDFLALTDSDVNATSPLADWSVNAVEGRIEQLNNVRGGGRTSAQPRKAGAQLLLRPEGTPVPLQHLVLGFEFSADLPHGIGCVLRWQDSENYYYFLISETHNYQIFGKKIAGSWSFLDVGGQSTHDDIDFSQRQRLQVVVLENRFLAYLDEGLICEGQDDSLAQAGEAGLLAHSNDAAYFYTIDLVKLNNSKN